MIKQLELEFEKQTGRSAYYHKDFGAYCYKYTEWLEEYADWLEQRILTSCCSDTSSSNYVGDVQQLRKAFKRVISSAVFA